MHASEVGLQVHASSQGCDAVGSAASSLTFIRLMPLCSVSWQLDKPSRDCGTPLAIACQRVRVILSCLPYSS